VGSTVSDTPSSPVMCLADMIPPLLTSGKVLPHSGHFKFIMSGLMSAVAAPPTCAVMCPPLTTKNWASYKPLIAIGMKTFEYIENPLNWTTLGQNICRV
jgi:hypothetical protein